MGWFDDNHWAGEAYNCGMGYMAQLQSEYIKALAPAPRVFLRKKENVKRVLDL